MILPIIRDAVKTFIQNYYAPDMFLWRLPKEHYNSIALTFDDGPDPEYTLPLLVILSKYNIKANFFLIGEKIETYPEIVKEIVAQGHAIVGHTCTHRQVTTLSKEQLIDELQRTRVLIKSVTGVETTTYRPPKGLINYRSLKTSINAGYRVIHWSRSYSDYLKDGEESLWERVSENPIKGRDIVLLHDNNPFTLRVMERLAPLLNHQSFKYYLFH